LGWTAAGKLEPGQQLASNAGSPAYVVRIERQPQKKITVYNFEVEEYHTYFVGDVSDGVLVHNDCTDEAAKVIAARTKSGLDPGEPWNVMRKNKDMFGYDGARYQYHDVVRVGDDIIDTLTFGNKNPVHVDQWKAEFDIKTGGNGKEFDWWFELNKGSGEQWRFDPVLTKLLKKKR
jgi:hypothetical protein